MPFVLANLWGSLSPLPTFPRPDQHIRIQLTEAPSRRETIMHGDFQGMAPILTAGQIDKISRFEAMVKSESRKQNLVSSGDLPVLRQRHTEDSLQLLHVPFEHAPSTWLDMGCGAGFPLIPLAIALPETRFIGVEPRGNRARFLSRVVRELELEVQILASAIETVTPWPNILGHMDIVSCRALGSLTEDAARALPILKPGGLFATLKSEAPLSSIDGYDGLSYVRYRLSGDPEDRHLVFAQKPPHGQ